MRKDSNLVNVSPEDELSMLKNLGLDNQLQALPDFPESGDDIISPNSPCYKANYIFASVKSLDDLRRLWGVPVDVANRSNYDVIEYRDTSTVPDSFTFTDLDADTRSLVRDTAIHMLIGPTDSLESLNKTSHPGIVKYMLEESDGMPVLVGKDLIVKDGEVKTITQTGTVVFNNVIVYGNGEIKFESSVKLVAQSIQHLA